VIELAYLARLRAQADEVRADLAERETNQTHAEVMAATRVPLPAVIYKQYGGDQPVLDDNGTDDVEPPMFTDEQLDTLAQVLAEVQLGVQAKIDDAIAPLNQRLTVVEAQLSMLTILLGNSGKSFELSEVIRKVRGE
jgi:hypothetical protein